MGTGLLAEELPDSGGEVAPQGDGSSGKGGSKPLGTDDKWKSTSEGLQTYPSAAAHCFRSVDWSAATIKTYEIDEGNDFIFSGSQTHPTANPKGRQSINEMQALMSDEGSIQSLRNSRMGAIEIARNWAIEVGTSEPPPWHELSEAVTVKAMQGSQESEVVRAWDTGATAGMTKPGSTKGILRRGRTARVTTGAGIVKTNGFTRA